VKHATEDLSNSVVCYSNQSACSNFVDMTIDVQFCAARAMLIL